MYTGQEFYFRTGLHSGQSLQDRPVFRTGLTCEADAQYGDLHSRGETQEELDVFLEDVRFGEHKAYTDNDFIETIKIGQILPIHITPHVEGVVNSQPSTAYLRHEAHPTITLQIWGEGLRKNAHVHSDA